MMPAMKRISALFVLVLCLAVAGVGDAKKSNKKAQEAFDDYNNALRWGDIVPALAYVDPETQKTNPLTDLERKRFETVQITSVTLKDSLINGDGSYDRIVEIKLIGKYTQRERIVTDHQHWRWDAKAKRYWLVSGLPDSTASD